MKHIVAFLNAYTQGKSGGDVCFVEIYKRMKDVKLTVVTSALGQQFCKENGLKATYILTSHELQFSNVIFTYLIRTWIAMNKTSTIAKADAVYSTSDAIPDVLPALVLSSRLPCKWIGNVFHLIPWSRTISYFSQKLSHLFLKSKADYMLVDNQMLKKKLVSQHFNGKKISLRYPGIDFKTIGKIKSLNKFSATSMIRIHPSKGIFDLINVWKNVVVEFPTVTLGIIGTGEKKYIDQVKELIHQYDLEKNITMLGYVEDEKAFGFIKGSSMFIFPSHEEGFGMALGEALACRTPAIAYDLPVYKETFKPFITTVKCYNRDLLSKAVMLHFKSNRKSKIDIKQLQQFSWEQAVKIEAKNL